MESKLTKPIPKNFEADRNLDLLLPLAKLSLPNNDDAYLLQQLERCRQNIFVIDDNNGPVCFAAYSSPYWCNVALVEFVIVTPEYRRQRLGTRLLSQLEITAAAQGLNVLAAPVLSSNKEAISFLMANNFNFQSILTSYFSAGGDLCWLDKHIEAALPESE